MPATIEQFEPFIDDVLAAPSDVGTVELVVCRPAVGERRVLETAELVPGRGLVGDNYVERGSTRNARRARRPARRVERDVGARPRAPSPARIASGGNSPAIS